MKILSTSQWSLSCADTYVSEPYPCGKVVSAVIMFGLRFGHHGSLELDQLNSMVIT